MHRQNSAVIYILPLFAHKGVMLLLCIEVFGNPSSYFVSDPVLLTQMLCSARSAHSLHAYQTVVQQPDKKVYDVTFPHMFWHGKQMIVSEQTRLCAFVLVRCFTKVSPG